MRLKELSSEVFVAEGKIVKVGREELDLLKERVAANQRKRIRLCAHQDLADKVHEMFVVLTKDTYIQPHKHLNKSESFQVIEGTVDAVIFDEDGGLTDVIRLGDYRSGRRFYYRLPGPYFHAPVVTSEVLVYYESTMGPFDRSDTVLAPWAPDESDKESVSKFMRQLRRNIAGFNCPDYV